MEIWNKRGRPACQNISRGARWWSLAPIRTFPALEFSFRENYFFSGRSEVSKKPIRHVFLSIPGSPGN
jgi:hypothetical protein